MSGNDKNDEVSSIAHGVSIAKMRYFAKNSKTRWREYNAKAVTCFTSFGNKNEAILVHYMCLKCLKQTKHKNLLKLENAYMCDPHSSANLMLGPNKIGSFILDFSLSQL